MSNQDPLGLFETQDSNDPLGLFSVQDKRNTTVLEDIGISLNAAATPIVRAAGLLGGGALGLLGADEAQSKVYETMQDVTKNMDDYWTPKDAEQSFGGKLGGMVATLPAQMLVMPFSSADTGVKAIDAGESIRAAQKAVGLDTLGNMAGIAIPASMKGNLLKRMVSGAAGNVAQDVLVREAIQGVSDTKEMKQQFENTPETVALSGILGAGFGMLPNGKPSVTPTETKNRKLDKAMGRNETENAPDPTKMIETSLTSYSTLLREAQKELAGIKDKTSQFYLDKLNDVNHLNKMVETLEIELGRKKATEPTQDTSRTDVEPPRIDEQHPVDSRVAPEENKSIVEPPRDLPKAGEDPELDALMRAFDEGTKGWVEDTPDRPIYKDKYDVNGEIMAKNISGYTKEALTNMLSSKTNKIEALRSNLERLNKSFRTQDENIEFARDAEKLALYKQEQSKIESALRGKAVDPVKAFDVEQPVWNKATDLVKAMESGGVRGGLEFVANNIKNSPYANHTYLGHLANKLLQNPLVARSDLSINPKIEGEAGYNNYTGKISFNDPKSINPINVIHEAVHSAVNKVLFRFEQGKPLSAEQAKSASAINNLYNTIKSNKEFMSILERNMGKDKLAAMMENPRELVTHGMTDLNAQAGLRNLRMTGSNVMARLTNAIKDMLGLKGNERTALEEVVFHGEAMIAASDGAAPRVKGMDFVKKHTAEGMVSAVKNGSVNIFSHVFTAQLPQLMRDNKHFTYMADFIQKADHMRESLLRDILTGRDSVQTYVGNKIGWAFNLSAKDKPNAVIPAMRNLSDVQLVKVHEQLIDGMRNGVEHTKTLEKYKSQWTPEEHNFALSVVLAENRIWESAVRMQGKQGLNEKMRKQPGHITIDRLGDHVVEVKLKGVTIKLETFLSAGEANNYKEKYQKLDSRFSVEQRNSRNEDRTQNIKEFMEKALDEAPAGKLDEYIAQKLKDFEEQNSAVGTHMMKSMMLPGFIGDQGFMSVARKAQLLRDAIPRGYQKYTNSIMQRRVQSEWVQHQVDNTMSKTDEDLIGFYVRTKTGDVVPENSTVRKAVRDLSTATREKIDDMFGSVFGYKHRDKHALDRFTGIFGTAFYTANITMKPAIWIAQPLQALMSSRSAFKEGASVTDVLGAFGSSISMMAKGKYNADPDFLKAIYYAGHEGNVLHPQLVNEYNDIKIGKDPNSTLNKVVDMATGKTPSAAGDSFSRFASFTFFYNLHKKAGLRGEALYQKASRDTTDNMYAYGQKNLPAIYREIGIFGEQAAPLTTFAHGQAGNMIVDAKEFVQGWKKSFDTRSLEPGFRASAPLIMTAAVTMILGGAISMPVIAEYELLRMAGISMGWWDDKAWPSASDHILKNSPLWVSHGMLTEATDMDLDASMRYTSLLKKITDVQQNGMSIFFPTISWGATAVGSMGTLASEAVRGNHTITELDKAIKNTVPKGWPSGAVDAVRNNGEEYTRMGSRGGAGVERSTAEKVAPWFGVRSAKEAMVSQAAINDGNADESRTQALARAAQLYNDGKDEAAMKIYMKHEPSPSAAIKAIISQAKLENTPAALRGIMSEKGIMSYEQMRKAREHQTTQMLDKLYGRDN